LLTYEFAWEHVGWRYLRSGSGYHAMVGWADYAVCLLLAGGAAGGLAVKLLRRRGGALYGVMPVLAAAGFLAVGAYGRKWEPIVLGAFNVYLLALGAGTLAGGVRAGRMRLVNGGLLVLSMLFVARFFDSGMGFVARGLAFIAVGAGFLAVNLLMGRRLKGARA
jgi:hypothetical protein